MHSLHGLVVYWMVPNWDYRFRSWAVLTSPVVAPIDRRDSNVHGRLRSTLKRYAKVDSR